ncbi:hypothetical protein HMPREF3038_00302 [Akkermansia sp. KLE1797]|nr:hypothetical protein HMPREF3038_00302 [Akkermansia sp. KLE1797]KXU54948.1 hypothetical protein HMPREF3039_00828 [Akkermansia sp. KLE1798]KZA04422.1 hypothetical protein HMPREF1326_01933 [Akkermansia sp. KLE1605]
MCELYFNLLGLTSTTSRPCNPPEHPSSPSQIQEVISLSRTPCTTCLQRDISPIPSNLLQSNVC